MYIDFTQCHTINNNKIHNNNELVTSFPVKLIWRTLNFDDWIENRFHISFNVHYYLLHIQH